MHGATIKIITVSPLLYEPNISLLYRKAGCCNSTFCAEAQRGCG